MTMSVNELMDGDTLVAYQSDTVTQIRLRMLQNGVNVLPVVDQKWSPVGIVKAGDLLLASHSDTPVSQVMSKKIYTIPQHSLVRQAASMMRRHKTHDLIVTQNNKVKGLLNIFDLLPLLEFNREHIESSLKQTSNAQSSPIVHYSNNSK